MKPFFYFLSPHMAGNCPKVSSKICSGVRLTTAEMPGSLVRKFPMVSYTNVEMQCWTVVTGLAVLLPLEPPPPPPPPDMTSREVMNMNMIWHILQKCLHGAACDTLIWTYLWFAEMLTEFLKPWKKEAFLTILQWKVCYRLAFNFLTSALIRRNFILTQVGNGN